jgi:hypothetical protein
MQIAGSCAIDRLHARCAMHSRTNRSACDCGRGSWSGLSIAASWSALFLAAMYAPHANALDAPAGATEVPAGLDSDQAETPDSTEQGQTQMPESFDRRPVAALLHESRLVGLRDTTLNVQIRSFYLDRDNFDTTQSQAWTLGGSAGFKTGYFADFVAIGATGYTSQRLEGPYDKDGTKLLQPGQQPYTVAGELYGQFRLTDTLFASVGRRGFDTPFINTQDSLMTPNTFVVYSVQGVTGSPDGSTSWRFGAGYVDQIKPRNAQDFESMATAAGAPSGVERGVYVAGANYKTGGFSIGMVDYYSADIIDIVYTEIKYAIPLEGRVTLRFGAQYTDQHSTGGDLLTGKSFTTDQYGLKAEIGIGPTLFTAARTLTAVGTTDKGSGTDLRNPWGAYPGYTAVQIENFYRAGENATLLRAAYNFPKFTALSVYGLWVNGSTPNVARQYAQREYDLNVQWKGVRRLTLLARYGHVSQGGPSDQHEDEVRLALYYQLR